MYGKYTEDNSWGPNRRSKCGNNKIGKRACYMHVCERQRATGERVHAHHFMHVCAWRINLYIGSCQAEHVKEL